MPKWPAASVMAAAPSRARRSWLNSPGIANLPLALNMQSEQL
jgi:hypothetical protein